MSRLLNINLIYGFRPVNCFFHKLRTFHTSWETLKKESSCKILKANGLFKEQPSPTSRCGRVWGLDSAQTERMWPRRLSPSAPKPAKPAPEPEGTRRGPLALSCSPGFWPYSQSPRLINHPERARPCMGTLVETGPAPVRMRPPRKSPKVIVAWHRGDFVGMSKVLKMLLKEDLGLL